MSRHGSSTTAFSTAQPTESQYNHHDHQHYPHDHHDHNGHNEKGHPHQRPQRRYRMISIATGLFTFATFVLYLLVGLSLPIIKNIWILSIDAQVDSNQPITSIATKLKFGVWGICAYSRIGDDECYGPRLGYSLTDPVNIAALIGEPSLVNAITKAFTVVLILHPICAGFALLVLLLCLCVRNFALSICALITSIALSLLGVIVLGVDLALVIVAKEKVPDATNDLFSVSWGNAVWMVLTAVVCSWLSVVVLSIRACGCFGIRRRYYGES